jgi:hypothetical protein
MTEEDALTALDAWWAQRATEAATEGDDG